MRLEEFFGDFDVFEVVGAVGAENGLFVTFAENEHDVARFCEFEGFFDGSLAVENDKEVLVESFASFFGTFDEHAGNFLRIFVTGVIFGNNDNVAVLAKNLTARFASGMVAFTGAAVNGDDFRLVILWFDASEDFFESVGSMSIVDDDFKILTSLNTSHATFNGFETSNTVGDLLISEADELTNADGGKGIIDIEFARNLGFDREDFILSVNIKIISHIMA